MKTKNPINNNCKQKSLFFPKKTKDDEESLEKTNKRVTSEIHLRRIMEMFTLKIHKPKFITTIFN